MAKTTIEWTATVGRDGTVAPGYTFNPWTGCQHVSAACDHCYAEAQAKRAPKTFGGWGPHAERRRTSESYWRQPLLWNKRAAKEGRRLRVFCASMADVFDNQVPVEWREDLWALIHDTPHLDWLLLTKRPGNIRKMLPPPFMLMNAPWPWPNVWLGTTVEDQRSAMERIPMLLNVSARLHFLSCEPMLEGLDLTDISMNGGDASLNAFCAPTWADLAQGYDPADEQDCWGFEDYSGGVPLKHALANPDEKTHAEVGWVIAGGESGPHARPSHPGWFRSLRDQCAAAGVPFFFKQWGEFLPEDDAYDRDLKCIEAGPPPGGMYRVGKKAAGALLDGREHREWPTP